MATGAPHVTLARKQATRHEDWLPALRLAYSHPDTVRARDLVFNAALRLRQTLAQLGVTASAYSWSGGKDSMVCERVARYAAVTDHGVCVLTAALEYPAFDAWVEAHQPAGLTVVRRPMDMVWLSDHPGWLFPTTSAQSARWFRQVQHTGQRLYMRNAPQLEGHDITATALLMGRRFADGNHCGPDGVYRDRDGFWRVSPIFDWTHEDVLCVLGAYSVDLAPCYRWPEGFRVATGPWPKRRRHPDGLAATWRLVHQIDPAVVQRAAEFDIQGAGECLRTATT